jgi:petrobactin synthase
MKTKQQVGECMHRVLVEKMDHLCSTAFHTDARLREDLALDSAATLQLLVLLEVELGLGLPEETVMNHDLDTVRNVAKLLYDAQERPPSSKILEYEEDIKLHCFVSCLSEVLKRHEGLEHRVLYFGVWDSEIVVSDRCEISYHSETISHAHFLDWYERLYGMKVESWYDETLSKDENAKRLASLVETRSDDEHIMVMLDMHQLPERVNEFNKDPFPHYLMLGPTQTADEWMMYDPDYRWEGVVKRSRILQAMKHPSVRGGFIFSDKAARAPHPRQIKAYFDACMRPAQFPMAEAIREVLTAHLEGRDRNGEALSLSGLARALEEVPILSIRKYAYEHGLAFFWRELGLSEQEFDDWCEVIATLVKTYKLLQFQAVKLATTGERKLADRIFAILGEQEMRERQIKQRMLEVYRLWCNQSAVTTSQASVAGEPS